MLELLAQVSQRTVDVICTHAYHNINLFDVSAPPPVAQGRQVKAFASEVREAT